MTAPQRTAVRYLEGDFEQTTARAVEGAEDIPVWIVDTHQWIDAVGDRKDREKLYKELLAAFEEADPDAAVEVAAVQDVDAYYVSDFENSAFVDPVYGHSRFIESIIGRLAPSADIEHVPAMTNFGVTSDSVVEARLRAYWNKRKKEEANQGNVLGPGIVNLSLGTYSMDDETPLATRKLIAELRNEGWILVASAGNDLTCRPMWPAASPEVIGVAATASNGPASFTNYGPWVDACAPGQDVVAIFPEAMTEVPRTGGEHRPPANDEQSPMLTEDVAAAATPMAAVWSGTSFSTPAVVGVICHAAAELMLDGAVPTIEERLRLAADNTVNDPALLRLPGLGTVVNVT